MQFGSPKDRFPCFTRLNPCVAHYSTDSIPWVHHSREEGSLDYDGGFVRLQIHMNFDMNIHHQHVVWSFIHFCEVYLGISPHFPLWQHLFCVKTTEKRACVVGAVIFCLRSGLKLEWIDMDLPDNTASWRLDWFYIVDQRSALPKRTGHKPVKIPE
jgi:hypothetical protein